MHVHLAHAQGTAFVNIQVLHFVLARPKLNAALWKVVLQYNARPGNAPKMVCADFNFEPSNEYAIPREYFTTIRMGQMMDVMQHRAQTRGQDPLNMCSGGPRGQGSMEYWQTLGWHWRSRRTGHSILAVAIDLDVTAQRVMKLMKLLDPPESGLHPEEQHRPAQAMWGSVDK